MIRPINPCVKGTMMKHDIDKRWSEAAGGGRLSLPALALALAMIFAASCRSGPGAEPAQEPAAEPSAAVALEEEVRDPGPLSGQPDLPERPAGPARETVFTLLYTTSVSGELTECGG